jgi:hypothetical protein
MSSLGSEPLIQLAELGQSQIGAKLTTDGAEKDEEYGI